MGFGYLPLQQAMKNENEDALERAEDAKQVRHNGVITPDP